MLPCTLAPVVDWDYERHAGTHATRHDAGGTPYDPLCCLYKPAATTHHVMRTSNEMISLAC